MAERGEKEKEKAPVSPITLEDFAAVLMVFLNAHLASRWGNEVVVYGALPGSAIDINRRRPPEVAATSLVAHDNDPSKNSNPEAEESRILILNATPGGAEDAEATDSKTAKASGGGGGQRGYVGLMNCVFAGQKAKVAIDVLTLPPESTMTAPPIFLQQAAYLTEGIYWRWNGRGGLLQYLHSMYLPPPSLRNKPFTVPPQDAVDFRAVCFCHHDVVDVGFVCIFCEVKPICSMCKTKFPLTSLARLKQLAAHLQPIPIPATVPPPKQKKGPNSGVAQSPVTNKAPPTLPDADVIVVD
ncbi:hypothetical protein A1Q2_06922 [Trichosporon asahii var. asahii CBS 8904]|uniref:General transcription and DNA repair factor IIH subunit TFB4 n=1 Tax=Trichosporon asahii var. asahii (strain CBS 8904) TaxID=1220162 RepID=K1V4A8_TRIAC|nr:hypothetical protein A1Q2_06922 [Trichosporon asahii var. asahii CBS 8904]